jgi:hypothetical protein
MNSRTLLTQDEGKQFFGKVLRTLAPNQDPYQLGRVILGLIYLFTFGMNFMANWSHIRSGRILSSIVAKLTNQPNPQSQLTPGGIIVLIWLLMWALSSILAKLYIHFALKRRPQSMAIQVKGWQFPTKKLFRGRGNRRNNWFVSAEFQLFRRTENSRNSVPNNSAEECSEFRSVESKLSEFRSKACLRQKKCCPLCLLEQDFFKLIFFMSFSSVPSLGIDSSVNIIMPRNEHFLLRNKGSHCEFLQPNFFLNEILLPTLNTGG